MTTPVFVQSRSDDFLYRRGSLWVLLYADDIVLIGQKANDVLEVRREISERLYVKDIGTLGPFLDIMFKKDAAGVCLSQSRYVTQVLERFSMASCKPVSTLMSEGALREIVSSKGSAVDRGQNQELLGCLLFLFTSTRPDI